VGVASVFFGISEGGIRTHSEIGLRLTPEGTIHMLAGAPDLGQGVFSVLRQIAAQTMGIPLDSLVLVHPDTDLMPSAGATEASRQTFVSGNAVMRAAEQLLERLGRLPLETDRALDPRAWLQEAHAALTSRGEPVEEFGYFEPQNRPIDTSGRGVPHVTYAFASHLAQVEVDRRRRSVRVHRMVTAHDVGKAINPCALEGQIEGGLMMALGMALSEEYVPGRTARLTDYKVPRTTDLPDIVNNIVDEICPAVGPASAIANAVARATGVRPIRLPIRIEG
jgi:CO/xanthine dehydrogenase Mo-binding subunit